MGFRTWFRVCCSWFRVQSLGLRGGVSDLVFDARGLGQSVAKLPNIAPYPREV